MTKPAHILLVDDQKAVRDLLSEGLTAFGYTTDTADSAAAAREKLESGAYDLVLCDIEMPGEKGTDLLVWIKDRQPDLAVMMVTGIDDAGTAVSAMLQGAYDYVCKPFSLPEVRARTEQALEKRRLVLENRRYQFHLENLVQDRTSSLQQAMERIGALHDEVRTAYDHTLSALMIALDYRDNETQGHSLRVVAYADRLARELGIDEPELTEIRRGAMLHDVGKIGIPDAILRKPGKLDDEERRIMRLHPELGHAMLRNIDFLATPAEIVLAHQEQWDGKGYPNGLKHEEIPIGARIFAVVDTLDAMTSDRPYREALPYERVRQEMIEYAGTQFDPRVIEAFLGVPADAWSETRDDVQRQLDETVGGGIPDGLFDQVNVKRR